MMQVVKIEVSNVDPDVVGSAVIIVETKRGDTWTRESAKDVTSGSEDAKQAIQLMPNQRVVVEMRNEPDLKYDPNQAAAVNANQQEHPQGLADAPQKTATGDNIKAAEERMKRDREMNTPQGVQVSNAESPPNADRVKKDLTYSDKKPGQFDPGPNALANAPSNRPKTGVSSSPQQTGVGQSPSDSKK